MRLELQIRASESRRTFLKLCAGIQLWNPNHRRRVQESVSSEVVWVMTSKTDPGSCSVAVAGINAIVHVTSKPVWYTLQRES